MVQVEQRERASVQGRDPISKDSPERMMVEAGLSYQVGLTSRSSSTRARSTLPIPSSGSTSSSSPLKFAAVHTVVVVVVVVVARGGGGGEHVRPLAPEVVPVLEEPVTVVLVEDVPVLPRVALVLLNSRTASWWTNRREGGVRLGTKRRGGPDAVAEKT